MSAFAPPLESASTLAERQAAENWAANVAALRSTQPELAELLPEPASGLSFVFGRDGALTTMTSDQTWWHGCSLPRRAAQAILKTLDSNGRVSCFLAPPHAAQIRVALDKLRADQAVIVLAPELQDLAVALWCEDFSADTTARRLMFACGSDWRSALSTLFDKTPGLPTPEQFIRAAAVDHTDTDALIPIAQQVFAEQTTKRVRRIAALRDNWSAPKRSIPRICLVASSHFQLWEDGGNALAAAFAGVEGKCELVRFDNDDPTSAAPVALAEAAHECDAIVAINLARADLPEVLPREMPWITWLVREQIPSAGVAGPRDALLVADARWRSDAIAGGWKADRVEAACWPANAMVASTGTQLPIALIADTRPLDAPAHIVDLSSQNLLWEAVTADITNDPFVVFPDAGKYLRRRQRDMQIPDQGFDQALFLDLLITSAFQQSLARLMLAEKLPVRVHGIGWNEIAEFASISAGPIRSQRELASAVASSSALIYAWPIARSHPIDAMVHPVLRPVLGHSQFLNAARLAAQGRAGTHQSIQRALNADLVLSTLGRLRTR